MRPRTARASRRRRQPNQPLPAPDLERRLPDQPILARLLRHAPTRPQSAREGREGLHPAEPNRHECELDRDPIAVPPRDDQSRILIDMTWNDYLGAPHL